MWDKERERVTKPKDNSSPEQTGAAGKTRWNPYVMDDAELLKDLRGLGKPLLFENDADGNFCLVSEDDG